MKKLTAAITLTAMTATALPTAQAEEFLELYLTGVQVERTHGNSDDPFIVVFAVEENAAVSRPVFVPGENQPWENLTAGDIIPLNHLVWRGPAQDVMLQAHVYDYNTGLRDFVAGFTSVTSAIAGALITVGTGGAGAVAGAGVALAGQAASEAVRNSAGNHVALGEVNKPLELRRVGELADRPQYVHEGLYYDFYTVHDWNGASYGLFWEVRR